MTNTKNRLNILETQVPHGRVPKEVLEEIWALWNEDDDAELALKVALAALEYAICGETNFEDDKEVMRTLRRDKEYFKHNLDSYHWECDVTVNEKRLDEIARLYVKEHLGQAQIGQRLGISQPEVSKRWRLIQKNYPELIEKYE